MRMQSAITAFLSAKNARIFMGELWIHLLSAQNNPGGIPSIFAISAPPAEAIQQQKVL